MERVLITGIAGGQGRLLARRLLENYEVCGVDVVDWEGAPRGVRVHVVDLRKKKFEDVIRTELPTAIVHMGFVRHFRAGERTRHDVNVRGTKQLLDHCVNHAVQNLVVLSSSYVYGAFPENPYFMDEDAPLSASRSYPEIRDLVEVDTLASAYLWRYPHIRTCVLRPVNVLGYYVHSMIARYLRQSRVPTVMGFDPMMQFIHEEDVSEAIALSLEHGLQGVFNVVGPGEVPLSTVLRELDRQTLPVPHPLARPLLSVLWRSRFTSFPVPELDHIRYVCMVDGSRATRELGFKARHTLKETIRAVDRSPA